MDNLDGIVDGGQAREGGDRQSRFEGGAGEYVVIGVGHAHRD